MKTEFPISRRQFLAAAAAASVGAMLRTGYAAMPKIDLGERPHRVPDVKVLNPYGRVPVSFVIDDSTCLVNMGHYCQPQFEEAWGQSKVNTHLFRIPPVSAGSIVSCRAGVAPNCVPASNWYAIS